MFASLDEFEPCDSVSYQCFIDKVARIHTCPCLFTCAVALALNAQMFDEVPVDEHDRIMDIIVLGAEILACTEKGSNALTIH